MKHIYLKNSHGSKTIVEVTDEVDRVLVQTRREIWRNDAKERYYCNASLDIMTDCNIRAGHATSPEMLYISAEEKTERSAEIIAVLKTLTVEQQKLVVLLRNGVSGKEIAKRLGMTEPAVTQMKKRIQKKFEKFLF